MTSSTRREAPRSSEPVVAADLSGQSRSAIPGGFGFGTVGSYAGAYVLAHVVMRHYATGVMAAEVSGHYGFVRVIGFCAWSEVLHPPRRGR